MVRRTRERERIEVRQRVGLRNWDNKEDADFVLVLFSCLLVSSQRANVRLRPVATYKLRMAVCIDQEQPQTISYKKSSIFFHDNA